MQLELSPEERLLQESVAGFFSRHFPPDVVHQHDQEGRLPPELWQQMASNGWTALPIPSEYGGVGADVATAAVLTEGLARHFASIAVDYVLISFVARLLTNVGSETQRKSILPALANGSIVVALGMTEPGVGSDILSLRTTAAVNGGDWIINGQKVFTSMADTARYIVVLARTDPPDGRRRASGLSLFLVPADAVGVKIQRLRLLGMRAAGTCEVFLDDVRVRADALVGERGSGFYALLDPLANERILSAALSAGIAGAAFDLALEYAQQRQAFGRAIGAFQAIQHPLADTFTELTATRLLVSQAAWLQSNGKDSSLEAAAAKVFAAETAIRATDRGMRIMAGYGFVEESPMARYFRDARLQVFSPVSNEIARSIIGERLGLPKSY